MPKKNGYDRYLEFQFSKQSKKYVMSDFFNALFTAMGRADTGNLARIEKGFPEEVEAYKTWTRVGVKEFLANCNPDHHLMKALAEGKIAI